MTSGNTSWLRALLFCFLLLKPALLEAAACCASASAFGVGRLLLWEQAAVGLSSSFSYVFGNSDADSLWQPGQNPKLPHAIFNENLWGLIRILPRLSAHLQLPFLIRKNADPNGSTVSYEVGDGEIGTAIKLIDIGQYQELPALSLAFSLRAPKYQVSLGFLLEKTFGSWFLQSGYSLGMPFTENIRQNLAKKEGLVHQALLATGLEIQEGVTFGLLLKGLYQTAQAVNEVSVTNSDKRKLSASISYSHRFHPHFTFQSSLGTDMPISHLGKNIKTETMLQVGIRYGFF